MVNRRLALGLLSVLCCVAAWGVLSAAGPAGMTTTAGEDNRPSCVVPCDCPDDGLACTTESCDASAVCQHTIGAGFCVIGGGCVASGATSPQNQCLACLPDVSQTEYSPRSGPCDDGDACTTLDECDSGECFPGHSADCDDRNKCTIDECLPTIGCRRTHIVCDDHSVCTLDTCDPIQGCVYSAKDCSDGIECTLDSCDGATGTCLHAKRSTRLAYVGPAVALRAKPIVLSATLTENGSVPAAAGRAVTFRLGTQMCVGSTDSAGVARCTIVVNQTPGAKTLTLSFAGDGCYQASARSDSLWIN